MSAKPLTFVIITPVRNEASYIQVTIECMIQQTIQPLEWIIVDDGSSDNTRSIIKPFLQTHLFIKYICLQDRGYRKPGAGVIEAFYKGFNRISCDSYDILSKFDGDLQFPPNTLKKISEAFKSNPQLGLTGGTRYERKQKDKPFEKVSVPSGFVGGPFNFYRRKCFEDIGGLIKRRGWDGVDGIKANMKGWETGEIESLKMFHLKPTGSAKGEGLVKACEKYGNVSYYMGGFFWYFLLRAIGRSVQSRNYRTGYYMIRGYRKSIKSKKLRESKEFRRFLKRIQLKNIGYWVALSVEIFLRNLRQIK